MTACGRSVSSIAGFRRSNRRSGRIGIWPEETLRERIGPGEVGRAVAWENLTDEQKQFQPIKMAIHAAMVHRMDAEIGRVIEQVKAMRALENTVILFLSDNGASAEQIIRGDGHDRAAPPGSARTFLCLGPAWSSAANTPLRLHKSWVHEGGISTPLIVQWPAGIKTRGELRGNPGHITDLLPTILELAGGHWPPSIDGKPSPPLHGKSLVPAFTRDGSVTHDFFWWFHVGNRALRVGDWKIVASKKRAVGTLRSRQGPRRICQPRVGETRESAGSGPHVDEARRRVPRWPIELKRETRRIKTSVGDCS